MAQFTAPGDYELTGVAAKLLSLDESPVDVQYYVYADAGSHPGAVLGQFTIHLAASDIVEGELTTGVFNSTAPMPALTLVGGTSYWFGISGPGTIVWAERGSSFVPTAHTTALGAMTVGPSYGLQFAVYGTPVPTAPAVPEPGTLSLAGVALATVAGAKLRLRLRAKR
jgi:hypothetical protein